VTINVRIDTDYIILIKPDIRHSYITLQINNSIGTYNVHELYVEINDL